MQQWRDKNGNLSDYELTETAYTIINFNLSSTPVVLKFGACLPVECTQSQMDQLGSGVSSYLTSTVQSLLKTSINPHVYFVPDDVALELYFRKDEEFEKDYWFN